MAPFDPTQPFETIKAETSGFDPTQPFETVDPNEKPASEPYAFTKALVTSVRQGNPENLASALEGAKQFVPESVGNVFQSGADKLKAVAATSPEAYKPSGKGVLDSTSLGELGTSLAEAAGSGIGSTIPSLVTGGAGAAAGGLVGGIPGAVIGGAAGAFGTSAGMSFGEIYKALLDAKVDPATASKWALAGAIPSGALDVAGLAGAGAGKLITGAGKEAGQGLLKRTAVGLGKGAVAEGGTETTQEGIKLGLVSGVAEDKPFFTKETAKQLGEAAIGGAIVGGPIRGTVEAVTGRKKGPTTEEYDATKALVEANEAAAVPVAPPQPTRQLNLPFVTPSPDVTGQGQLDIGESAPLPEMARPSGAVGATAEQPDVLTTPAPSVTAQGELAFPRPLASGEQSELALGVPPPRPSVTQPSNPGIIPIETPSQREALIAGIWGPEQVAPVEQAAATTVAAIAPAPMPSKTAIPGMHPTPMMADIAPRSIGKPGPVFYSPLRKFVEERGPGSATAGQWNRTLAQAGLKKEELNDLKLGELLLATPERRLTLKEILAHIDDNSITVLEKVRSSVQPPMEQKAVIAQAKYGLTPEAWAALPVTRRHTLMINAMTSWQAENSPQYTEQSTLGERAEDVELIMHLPASGAQDYLTMHYPGVPNIVGTARMSVRRDWNGQQYVLIEEIQSDWLQEGRKKGFRGDPIKWVKTAQGYEYQAEPGAGKTISIVDYGNGNVSLASPFGPSGKFATIEAAQAAAATGLDKFRPPPAPFREAWAEMTFKRVLRWAADRGIRNVAWADSKEQMRRYPMPPRSMTEAWEAGLRRKAGMEKFYDGDIPRLARKAARDYGGTISEVNVQGSVPDDIRYVIYNHRGQLVATDEVIIDEAVAQRMVTNMQPGANYRIDPSQELERKFQQLELPVAAVPFIQMGQPQYSRTAQPDRVTILNTVDPDPATPEQVAAIQPLLQAFQSLVQKLGIGMNVKLRLHNRTITSYGPQGIRHDTGPLALLSEWQTGQPIVHVAVGAHKSVLELWSSLAHELGHLVYHTLFLRAPQKTQTAILSAHHEFRRRNPDKTTKFSDFMMKRDNVVANYFNTKQVDFNNPATLDDVAVSEGVARHEYWTGFDEWFAEEVAKWAMTSDKPLSVVERFFKGIADKIKIIVRQSMQLFGVTADPTQAVAQFLDKHMAHNYSMTEAGALVKTMSEMESTKANKAKMQFADTATAMQPETLAGRTAMDGLYKERMPYEVQESMAYADKFNVGYKYGVGVHQLAQANQHIRPLVEYVEMLAVAQLTKQQIMTRAQEVEKAWHKLGPKQGDSVSALIDDLVNMPYRTPDEVARGIARFPTNAELVAMQKKHGVDARGMNVVGQITESFSEHLTRYEAIMRVDAAQNHIGDPVKLRQAHESINQQMESLRNRPYFPAMHFGDYYVIVHDAAKNIKHVEVFETARRQRLAADEIRKKYNVPKEQMQIGKFEKSVKPLLGVPKEILKMMETRLELDSHQVKMMKALQFDLSPTQTYKHKYQYKRRTPGYSLDFRRAYASYFFYGANHFMRVQYAKQMRARISETRDEVVDAYNTNKRRDIVAYMADHLKNWLDPKPDWAGLRAVAFMWSLAYSPATAAQNLTQTVMTTHPFLASKFGDGKSVSALTRTFKDFSTWYKKGTLKTQTSAELKALSQGIRDGTITEAMAPELAGFAESRTLGVGQGYNFAQRALNKVNEWGSFLFELAEQTNRRLVFRATFKLATENPNAAYVKDMLVKHKQQYDGLTLAGWTPAEAAAYVTAKDATVETQFNYGKEYSARFMRGKLRSVFVFKTFMQNYTMFLVNYPQAAIRSLITMAFIGGLMAVPGSEDLKEILKAIGWRVFGKSFDLEKEARAMVVAAVGNDEFGRNTADLALHGIARRGFGIPTLMDMIGGTVGVDIPAPTFDRSRAVSMGSYLPVSLGALLGPPLQSPERVIAEQTQKASGALFGAGFNIYKALTDSQRSWEDSKRWERAVPRGMSSVTKAYRLWNEGQERSSTGAQVVKYNVRDTEQMMEVLGVAAGYTPLRQSLEWERILAAQDAVKRWHIEREGLLRQYGNAALGQDKSEISQVRDAIIAFNRSLPPEARGQAITSTTISKSVQMKAKNRAAQEGEMSTRKGDVPVMRKVQAIYPESKARPPRQVARDLLPSE